MDLVKNRHIRHFIAFLLIACIFYFLGSQLLQNWQELSNYNFKFNFVLLAISFILLFVNSGLSALVWKKTLELMSVSLSFKKSFKITYLSQLAKYLPGKIWAYFWQVHMCESEGIRKSQTILSLILQTVFYSASCVFIFWLSYFLWPATHLSLSLLLLFFIVSTLIFLHPNVLSQVMNFVLKKISNRTIEVEYAYSQVFSVFFVLLVEGICFKQ